ncbi:hypothetical protein D3C85_1486590 [compost metagenome]
MVWPSIEPYLGQNIPGVVAQIELSPCRSRPRIEFVAERRELVTEKLLAESTREPLLDHTLLEHRHE